MVRVVDLTGYERTHPCVLFTKHGPLLSGEKIYYEQLRRELHRSGFELLLGCYDLAAFEALEGPRFFLPHIPQLRAIANSAGAEGAAASPLQEQVASRFHQWHGSTATAPSEVEVQLWQQTLSGFVKQLNVALAVLWNGEHCTDLLLRSALEGEDCPIVFLERAFVPGFLHFDENAILADTTLGRSPNVGANATQAQFEEILRATTAKGTTWYPQPAGMGLATELQRRANGRRVVFFAGQVSGDTQAFLFSPHFQTPKHALAWLLPRIPSDKFFILGKHHPFAAEPAAEYQQLLGEERGLWTSQYPVGECLRSCDLFATVNSTTAYEALLAGKIPLLLGRSLLDHKGIAYHGTPDAEHEVTAWIDGDRAAERLERWRRFFISAVQEHFIPIDPSGAKSSSEWIVARTRTRDARVSSFHPTSPLVIASAASALEHRLSTTEAMVVNSHEFRLVQWSNAFTSRFPKLASALRRIWEK